MSSRGFLGNKGPAGPPGPQGPSGPPGPNLNTPNGYYIFDDFIVKTVGWKTIGPLAKQTGTYNHPGVLAVQTSSFANNEASVTSDSEIAIGNIALCRWLIQPFSNLIVGCVKARVGLTNTRVGSSTAGAWFEFNHTSSDWDCYVNGSPVHTFSGSGDLARKWCWFKLTPDLNGNCHFEIYDTDAQVSHSYEHLVGDINKDSLVFLTTYVVTYSNCSKVLDLDFFDMETTFVNRLP